MAATVEAIAHPAIRPAERLPVLLAGLGFAVLFSRPAILLARDWWTDPEAGHGLLLAPLALWLAWRKGLTDDVRPAPLAGTALLLAAVTLRYVSGLAAELFTMRFSMIIGAIGLILFWRGWPQLRQWWLPVVLLTLSIPLPDIVTGALAFPLQLRASRWGAALLAFRHVPVNLSGNIIQLPGRQLFVTEACSGLRSLTALLSLGVLVGGLWLRYPISRIVLVLAAIPVAMAVNAFRVFLTGFLVYFVSPQLGEGFMHLSEGWLLFVVAFVVLGAFTWLVATMERAIAERRAA
jgi:exosortase